MTSGLARTKDCGGHIGCIEVTILTNLNLYNVHIQNFSLIGPAII